MDADGVAQQTAPEPDIQAYAAPEPEPDVLADTRRDAVWWGLLCGGVLLLALRAAAGAGASRGSTSGGRQAWRGGPRLP